MQKTTEIKLIENMINLIEISDGLKKNFYQNIHDIIKNYQSLEQVVKVSEKTITDEHLKFIANLAIEHNGYVFGGSIRDSLCNSDSSYNDIDICLDLSDASKKIKILKISS